MDLAAYLDRIGYSGPVAPTLDCFRGVHRAHVLALTYENLDVQLGAPVTRDAAAAFAKIVTRRRGGWCYEMNGLFAWALEQCGFEVRRLAGAVMREQAGDSVIGNHLVLLLTIDGEDWIGDVGFGNGHIDPFQLREGEISSDPLNCRLKILDDGWWRYFDDPRFGGPSFDFNTAIASEAPLEHQSRFLQRDPSSNFVLNAVVQRWRDDAHLALRGRVLRKMTRTTDEKRLVASADEYVETLRRDFLIDLPEAARLWPAICRRHEEVFSDGAWAG